MFKIGEFIYGFFKVIIVDFVFNYIDFFKFIFDFDVIKNWFYNIIFWFIVFFDVFNGVIGFYGWVIFVEEFGLFEFFI